MHASNSHFGVFASSHSDSGSGFLIFLTLTSLPHTLTSPSCICRVTIWVSMLPHARHIATCLSVCVVRIGSEAIVDADSLRVNVGAWQRVRERVRGVILFPVQARHSQSERVRGTALEGVMEEYMRTRAPLLTRRCGTDACMHMRLHGYECRCSRTGAYICICMRVCVPAHLRVTNVLHVNVGTGPHTPQSSYACEVSNFHDVQLPACRYELVTGLAEPEPGELKGFTASTAGSALAKGFFSSLSSSAHATTTTQQQQQNHSSSGSSTQAGAGAKAAAKAPEGIPRFWQTALTAHVRARMHACMRIMWRMACVHVALHSGHCACMLPWRNMYHILLNDHNCVRHPCKTRIVCYVCYQWAQLQWCAISCSMVCDDSSGFGLVSAI